VPEPYHGDFDRASRAPWHATLSLEYTNDSVMTHHSIPWRENLDKNEHDEIGIVWHTPNRDSGDYENARRYARDVILLGRRRPRNSTVSPDCDWILSI